MRHTFLANNLHANLMERVYGEHGHGVNTWWKQGACRGHDPDLWFPEWPKPNEYREARAICNSCPVKMACLAEAMVRETGMLRYGMWGGKTPQERERMRPVNAHPRRNPQGNNHRAMASSGNSA